MPNADDVQVVVLLSAWSSGSTSIAGYLDRSGAYTCPPHQMTNDSRTPNSYESLEFRNAMLAFTDELTLQVKGRREDFVAWFETWLPEQKRKAREAGCSVIALKHPLAVNLIAEIHRISACRFVLITRSLAAIEKTRLRRGWAPVYGEKGAKTIYNTAWAALFHNALPSLSVPYEQFTQSHDLRSTLIAYCGLAPDAGQNALAQAWLRPG